MRPERAARARSRSWVQVNCTFFPQGPGRPPYVPWAELSSTLEEWRAEGRFARCFFMRKPPGLRLRFWGNDLQTRLDPTLVAYLEDAERRNAIRSFRFAVYEPEEFRFGGPTGMAVAHHLFDLETRTALRYEALAPADRTGLPRDQLSLALSNDLFRRCVDDAAELWDIWQRLWRALGEPALPPVENATDLEQVRGAMLLVPEFTQGLTAPAVDLLRAGCADNAQIAARLHAAEMTGRLRIGKRSWLSTACVFHWNRFGLNVEDAGQMVSRMLGLLDPHKNLR
jgi:thiopeptide-type bacteriocin biosynthesis protein